MKILGRTLVLALAFGCLFSGNAPAKSVVQLTDGRLLWAMTQPNSPAGSKVLLFASSDGGATWLPHSEIVRDATAGIDIGDGHLIRRKNGHFLYIYRHNYHPAGAPTSAKIWRIQVLQSTDADARTWTFHSSVTNHGNSDRGLWSSYILELSDGTLQAYYDDEYTPSLNNAPGHQWLTMKTWSSGQQAWISPVTVSRTSTSSQLARDGMTSVVEVAPGKLVATIESVDTASPYRGVIRVLRSDNKGSSWTWSGSGGRKIIYQPANKSYNALQPWMTKMKDGSIFLAFTTDEDRATPGIPSTGQLQLSVKYMRSYDGGYTWSMPKMLDARANLWVPGVIETSVPGTVFVNYFTLSGPLGSTKFSIAESGVVIQQR